MHRLLARSSSPTAYATVKAAAAAGAIQGTPVTLVLARDGTRRLYLEITTVQRLDAIELLIIESADWESEGTHYDFTEGAAFELSPLAYAAGKASP